MRAALALLALLALAGCVTTGTVGSSGKPVAAPYGFDEHCRDDHGSECPAR